MICKRSQTKILNEILETTNLTSKLIFSFGCKCGKDPNNNDQNAYKVAEKLYMKKGRHKRASNRNTQRIIGKMHLQNSLKI